MRVRVKTARGRKSSSTRWLDRQLNDPYVQEAPRRVIDPAPLLSYCSWMTSSISARGQRVVDLGAAPGGWTQISSKEPDRRKAMEKSLQSTFKKWTPLPARKRLFWTYAPLTHPVGYAVHWADRLMRC